MRKRDETRRGRQLGRAFGRRPGHSTVAAYLALFVALGGTGAWAADRITSKDISKNAVRSKHIKKNAVATKKIKSNAVTAGKLACKGNSAQDVMVRSGAVCIDRYESSIWTKRTGGTRITGAIPCNENGQDCKGKIFARSVKGVAPRASITWFQAQQALANSGKRLPSNAEWQQAVSGSPDAAPCNTDSGGPVNTGSMSGCVSNHGANDMVGNLWEWIADWGPLSDACGSWPAGYGDDFQCLAGANTTGAPGALLRGGAWFMDTGAGPFAVDGSSSPTSSFNSTGFRGAR